MLLKKLGLENIQDLLFYFPFRYDDFTLSTAIESLKPGMAANILGEVELIQNKRSFKKRMSITEALIKDETDTIKIIWFNQPFLTKTIRVGDKLSLAGTVNENNGQLTLISPIYEKISSNGLIHTSGLIPNYHLTASLTQKQIRFLIKEIIPLAEQIVDWLPKNVQEKLKLLDLNQALRQIHSPKNQEEILEARRRLMFGELFLRQLKAQIIKKQLKNRQSLAIKFQEEATRKFVSSLPFKLTNAQKKSAWEILKDLDKKEPMSRLLEGDVGSGKTIVVALALLNVALNKRQAALMVPTEILARQHFDSISKLFQNHKFKIALATHSRKDKDWENADIIIGTQALIQKNVKFKNLALAIVDEQHRFGVSQRKNILDYNGDKNKNSEKIFTPHFLSLTATPIPRSLALAIYGDLSLSIIDEMPTDRKSIITKIISETNRAKAYDFIRAQIKTGKQAFVVCPLIDESDKLGTKSVKKEHEKLDKEIFPELKIGLLHGKMKPKEKESIMADFLANKIQILVATSVIEVGIDIPNATIMIIEGAERFGLAQLHQFRGRVGRSGHQSYCFLFPSDEESDNQKTAKRLAALEKCNDGFSLAKIDLKMRGAGELYGTGQSGFSELQIASLFDYANIKKASEEASVLIDDDPNLEKYPLLKEKMGEWENDMHLE